MTYSSVPVAITETLSKKFLCSRSCFRKPSFQTLMPPLFIPKRNKSSKKIYLYPNSRSTLRFNSNKRTRMNASEMPICSLRSWRDSRVSAFVLVAKPRTRVAKPWEDWWRFHSRLRRSRIPRGFRPRRNMAARSRIPPATQARGNREFISTRSFHLPFSSDSFRFRSFDC